jgi:hypothetical protein
MKGKLGTEVGRMMQCQRSDLGLMTSNRRLVCIILCFIEVVNICEISSWTA